MMTIILDPIKHTGAAPEPIVLLAEAEQLTFTGATLTDNMAATILSPTGTALASGLIAGNAVTLDTRTSQAWDYISAQACGVTAPALLAIGDATALVAVLPIRVLRNNLYNLAPPSATVTVYPSMEQLQEILDRIAAADESADALLARAEALGVSIAAFEESLPGLISGAVTEITNTKTAALTDVEAAKTGALGNISDAKVAAIDEIDAAEATGVAYVEEKAREAVQDLDAKKQEGVTAVNTAVTQGETRLTDRTETGVGLVNQAADYAVDEINAVKQQAEAQLTPLVDQADASKAGAEAAQAGAEQAQAGAEAARTGAENAQHGAEQAQTAAETALNNGCIYQVREVASSAITLDKTLTAYKHTPTADTAYTFAAPAEATGKIIVFWLWVVMGETAHQLTFPAGVTWISEGSFGANTETLLAFMSTDGGATWQANVQWEKAVTA